MAKEISIERLRKVRKTREKVVAGLPEEKKKDRGEIRYRVSKILMEEDKALPLEERAEIGERAINRYLTYSLGDPMIQGHLEAVHAPRSPTGALVSPMKEKFPGIEVKEVIELGRWAEEQIQDYLESHPGLFYSEAIKAFRERVDDEKRKYVFRLKNRFDEKTGEIAQRAANLIDASWIRAKKPRLITDINRPEGARVTDLGIATQEFTLGAKEAFWEVLARVIDNTGLTDEKGKLTAPYLQISLHGAIPREEEFVIGGGLQKGKLPLDPEIARWFQERLEDKVRKEEIINEEGKLARVKIAIEGEKFSGAIVNVQYRFGDQIRHPGFGPLLQVVQLEMDRTVRKQADKLEKALAAILLEFSEEFRDEEAVRSGKSNP